jgi:hypothetical protein
MVGGAVDHLVLIANYGGILLAFGGTAYLIMVVITTVKATRRLLRYESWHLLHLLGYLGVGLALPSRPRTQRTAVLAGAGVGITPCGR